MIVFITTLIVLTHSNNIVCLFVAKRITVVIYANSQERVASQKAKNVE
jgi:hypothetical protein